MNTILCPTCGEDRTKLAFDSARAEGDTRTCPCGGSVFCGEGRARVTLRAKRTMGQNWTSAPTPLVGIFCLFPRTQEVQR